MPHFCAYCPEHADVWICQHCGRTWCSGKGCKYYRESVWIDGRGNICLVEAQCAECRVGLTWVCASDYSYTHTTWCSNPKCQYYRKSLKVSVVGSRDHLECIECFSEGTQKSY